MKSSSWILRDGRLSDLDAIIALDRITDNAPHWPRDAYEALFATHDQSTQQRHLIVAESIEVSTPQRLTLAGFAVVALHRTAPQITAELEDVIVAANLRRTGIGRALCEAAIQWARSQGATEVELEVRATSIGAIALYNQLGFRKSGRRPRYYSDPQDDALLMKLT